MALRVDTNLENYAVKDAESGVKYLKSKLLCVVGELINSEHPMTTLFNISQLKNISKPATEAIRAVAYLLGEQEMTKLATMISTQVKEMISGEVASHVVAAISLHITNLMKTADQLETNTKEVERLVERINGQDPPTQISTPNTNTPSYSNTVKGSNPQSHPMINTAERQILLAIVNGEPLYRTEQTATSIAKDVQRLNSAASAKWLWEDENQDHFLNALGTPVEMKNRIHSVIVPFVPISSPVDNTNWLRALELENDLPDNSISLVK
ncbi:hypothetical protein PAXRUDRAFT_35297 [Paxillus rubicundulus Ve08.2h10]|uniref:Unplaced genomic scaffold scaffold_688, whole genome shotgun sequence n=1 Tax=Paxillus rubicundulus Ve08.2h10 TaxID=930991 RepID=A0A0D0D1Y7_9AGAM|nr:hypothetical protein PAXRUDRAFT_35297 [Paxillus rubicundulus Ve08.2h10]